MTDTLFHLLHHRGWELRKGAHPESEWVDLIGDRYLMDPAGEIARFMDQRNRNVIENARKSGRQPHSVMVRRIIKGVPHWCPESLVDNPSWLLASTKHAKRAPRG